MKIFLNQNHHIQQIFLAVLHSMLNQLKCKKINLVKFVKYLRFFFLQYLSLRYFLNTEEHVGCFDCNSF